LESSSVIWFFRYYQSVGKCKLSSTNERDQENNWWSSFNEWVL